MLKTNNLLAAVPFSTPEPNDSQIQVPPLFLVSGQIPAPLPNSTLTSTPGGLNSYFCQAELTQAASTGLQQAFLTTFTRGVWDIRFRLHAVSDFTLAPTVQSNSQALLFLLSPNSASICNLAKWIVQQNVPAYQEGHVIVTFDVDGWSMKIATVNTGVAQTLFMGATAYVRAVI